MPRPGTLDDLPDRITRKIEREEATGCWLWTGSMTAARQRYARPRNSEDGPDRGYDGREGTHTYQRPIPNCYSTELGYPVAAHREIYALTHGISVRRVPKLERCRQDRCVNPGHTRPIGEVRRAEPVPDLPVTPVPGSYTWERCLALLREHDVSPNIERTAAADEAFIPQDQLTEACWAQYVRETPDDDD